MYILYIHTYIYIYLCIYIYIYKVTLNIVLILDSFCSLSSFKIARTMFRQVLERVWATGGRQPGSGVTFTLMIRVKVTSKNKWGNSKNKCNRHVFPSLLGRCLIVLAMRNSTSEAALERSSHCRQVIFTRSPQRTPMASGSLAPLL